MPKRRLGWIPQLQHLKSEEKGRVRVPDGQGGCKDHYLGQSGCWPAHQKDAPKCVRAAYEALMADFLAGKFKARPAQRQTPSVTCGEVCRAYAASLKGRSAYHMIGTALLPVFKLFEHLPAAQFDAVCFDECRRWHMDPIRYPHMDPKRKNAKRSVAPRTAQQYAGYIKSAFRWGARPERKMVPPAVAMELSLVTPLVDEDEVPVEPAPETDVRIVIGLLPRKFREMLELQLLTGMRPGEVVQMRPCDVDRSGDVWLYKPAVYKTRRSASVRKSGGRKVWLGPRAQAILGPLLDKRLAGEYLWITQPGSKMTLRVYRNAVRIACVTAGVPVFHPRQVRHTTATLIEGEMGLEYAQNVLGHTKPDMTRIYAHAADDRAKKAMRGLG